MQSVFFCYTAFSPVELMLTLMSIGQTFHDHMVMIILIKYRNIILTLYHSFSVCVLVVLMGEEYYHAKDYTKALK